MGIIVKLFCKDCFINGPLSLLFSAHLMSAEFYSDQPFSLHVRQGDNEWNFFFFVGMNENR